MATASAPSLDVGRTPHSRLLNSGSRLLSPVSPNLRNLWMPSFFIADGIDKIRGIL